MGILISCVRSSEGQADALSYERKDHATLNVVSYSIPFAGEGARATLHLSQSSVHIKFHSRYERSVL